MNTFCAASRGSRALALCIYLASSVVGAADSAKVLHVALIHSETGFDPAQSADFYSEAVIAAIMEPLLTFDYLARPVKVIPLTAAALPEISGSGKTYTFHIKQGVFFADDPAFKGTKRELTANDYVYAIKRLIDPANRSPNAFYVVDKIVGLAEAEAAAKSTGKFDYDARIAGLEVLERYTLRIHLKNTDYSFPNIMALPALSAVAHEVVETYPGDVAAHPVGTGPYLLKNWIRASRITLEANPNFRPFVWNFTPGDDPNDKAIAAAMRGKTMPQIGVIEISVMEEAQSRWLAFQLGELDLLDLPGAFAPIALPDNRLAANLASKGVYLSRILNPQVIYTTFNMRDPVLGGLSPDRIALRRAIAMAYDVQAEIDVIRKGQAAPLQMLIPPGVAGYSPGYQSDIAHDPAAANKLLDRMGYRKGPDGYRTLPDGTPLVITYSSQTDATAREHEEIWSKAFDAINVRMVVDKGKASDQFRAAIRCQYQMWDASWLADYPDGDNFVQLLYSHNINQSNIACYASPKYDALYERSRTLPDSVERTQLFEQMARQLDIDAPWRIRLAPYKSVLAHPRVIGYKVHPVMVWEWIYTDIDTKRH